MSLHCFSAGTKTRNILVSALIRFLTLLFKIRLFLVYRIINNFFVVSLADQPFLEKILDICIQNKRTR